MNDTTTASNKRIADYLRQMGLLRLALGALVLVLIGFAPSPSMETVWHGWGLVRTAVIPALGPMVFMVLLFDMFMSVVLMGEQRGQEPGAHKRALLFDSILALALLLVWGPFVISLLRSA